MADKAEKGTTKSKAPETKQQKLKGQRKDIYSISNDPFQMEAFKKGVEAVNTPQTIDLSRFRASREHELQHFRRILSKKVTSKLEHQLLPKHLRRRAMSHNRYRIPVRVRFKALQESVASEAEVLQRSRGRKHRRKLKYLLNFYERRQRNNKWMESHVWHAKRFHMAKMFGWCVPVRCADKSKRAVHRFVAKNGAVLYDQSYHTVWSVKVGGSDIQLRELHELLAKHGAFHDLAYLHDFQKFRGSDFMEGKEALKFTLLLSKHQIVGPVQILRAGEAFLVSFHPLAEAELSEVFRGKPTFLNQLQIVSKDSGL